MEPVPGQLPRIRHFVANTDHLEPDQVAWDKLTCTGQRSAQPGEGHCLEIYWSIHVWSMSRSPVTQRAATRVV